MKGIKIGIVGLEYGAKVLAPAFRKDLRCEVVALAATRLEKAISVAQRLGVPNAFGDYESLLASGIDAVAIATPPAAQVVIAKSALRRGIRVFADKPLGVTPADTEALLALSRGLTTMVDFEFVESAPFQRFRKLVKARGAVELSVEWRLETYAAKMRLESWKTRATEGGGALHTFGSHIFYNLEWCLGRMDSLTAKTFKRPDDPRDTHTGVEFTAGFVSGSRAQVFLDTAASAESVHTWRFDQVELANRSKDYLGGFTVSQGGKVTFETPPSPEDGRIAAVASLVGRFVDGILGKGPSEPSFAAGHRVQVLIDKAFQSEGRLVRV